MNGITKYHEDVVSDQRPVAIEDLKDGKGSFNYNFSITAINVEVGEHGEQNEVSEATETSVVKYRHSVLVMEAPCTQNHIIECLISEKYPYGKEQKLINDYNAAQMGIFGSKTSDEAKAHIEAYKAFLTDRASLKEMVEQDCAEVGIPNTL